MKAPERLTQAIIRKVSLHAAGRSIFRDELRRLIDHTAEGRRADTILVPGAYFVVGAMRFYQQAGLPCLNRQSTATKRNTA